MPTEGEATKVQFAAAADGAMSLERVDGGVNQLLLNCDDGLGAATESDVDAGHSEYGRMAGTTAKVQVEDGDGMYLAKEVVENGSHKLVEVLDESHRISAHECFQLIREELVGPQMFNKSRRMWRGETSSKRDRFNQIEEMIRAPSPSWSPHL